MGGGKVVTNDKCQSLPLGSFYYNRLTRIMPSYYLCTLLAVPLLYGGYGPTAPG